MSMLMPGDVMQALLDAGAAIPAGTDVVAARDGAFSLRFPDIATAPQRQAANAALAALDKRPRRRRAVAAILADLNALVPVERMALLMKWLATEAAADARLLRRLGQAIDGDEPDV